MTAIDKLDKFFASLQDMELEINSMDEELAAFVRSEWLMYWFNQGIINAWKSIGLNNTNNEDTKKTIHQPQA